MANRYTIPQIKDFLNRAGDRSGFAFDKNGPYFANAERLKAMRARFEGMIDNHPHGISEYQRASIKDWFTFLANRYGI